MVESLPPVFCLLGPTASGKTSLAVELRQTFGFDVISVDSALVYRRMDIGTAKPDTDTLSHTPHALIDLIEPWESYSVSRFLIDVHAEIQRVHRGGGIPLLVGGTMMYFHALWNGLSELPPADPQTRAALEKELGEQGLPPLHRRLQAVDPVAAERIDQHDPQRVLRALEVFLVSGVPLSQLQNARQSTLQYDFFNLAIFPGDRAVLHDRIARRFRIMLDEGFLDEVEGLLTESNMHVELPSMRCVGYRQACAYLSGELSLKDMTDKAIAATRQLAKRQITWMRKMPSVSLCDLQSTVADLECIEALNQWRDRHRTHI
jgi:tRNA dimethylallyltransferase